MRARNGQKSHKKSGEAAPDFSPPVLQPGALQGSSQPERRLPPAPRRIPVPPAPVRRVTPPRRQPKGR